MNWNFRRLVSKHPSSFFYLLAHLQTFYHCCTIQLKMAILSVTVFGLEPDMTREGGSIPVTLSLQNATNKNVMLLPMGACDDSAHSQNEKMDRSNYINGVSIMIRCKSFVFVAERSSLPDSSSGVSSRMWVRIPAVTLVSLSKTLNHNCFSPPRG